VDAAGYRLPVGFDLRTKQDFAAIVEALAPSRVVYVGETHTRYDHHLNQLAIIEALHRRDANLAIGMEFFQRPFQVHLDDYIAGRVDEATLLKRTEYYDRWRFDYRLYRPILRYAREHGIPAVALNMEQEITRKVGASGIDSLSAEERARLPADMDRDGKAYAERLHAVFAMHPEPKDGQQRDFESFLSVQLLWDETMAETAAAFLRQHPDHRLVVLAGSGHVAYRDAIPDRLARRLPVASSVVVQEEGGQIDVSNADIALLTEELSLPPVGKLGIFMEDTAEGVRIGDVAHASGAKAAGLATGDYIRSLGGMSIADTTDLRIAMLDRRPGEAVDVIVSRNGTSGGNEELALRVMLQPL
jgi:uncharacterized iron-regulated protein